VGGTEVFRITVRESAARLPRAKSRKTDKVFRVPVPWEGLSKHFTFGFEAAALLLMRDLPGAQVAAALAETDTTAVRDAARAGGGGLAMVDMSAVRVVGCDEAGGPKGTST